MNEREYRVILNDMPDVLDIQQVSITLRVSTKTCYKLLRDNKLASIRVGRAYRIPKVYLIQYLMAANQEIV